MQILHTTSSEAPAGALEDSELSAALRHLEENMDGGGRPVAHLTTACFAALQSLEMMAADETAPPAARFARAMHVDEQIEACYERIGRWLLAATLPLETLSPELMRSSAQLFHNLYAVYSGENAPLGAAPLSERDPALPIVRALWCLGMHAKWTYFMHQETNGSLWRTYHSLYERAESQGAARRAIAPYRDPDVGKLSCADVYVQSLLLGMLNAGNLSPQQLELAHRWVVAYVRDAGIAASDTGTDHVFHVCLDSDRGLQAGTPPSDAPATVRFIDIQQVCAKLMESRESLRKGRIDLSGATGLQVAVLDYGAFLDLAERFWSPSQNQVQERAPRLGMDQQPVEAIVGFDRVYQAAGGSLLKAAAQNRPTVPTGASNVTFLYPDTEQVVPPFNCILKDRSASGVGLLVPGTSDAHMPAPGALIVFRLSKTDRWEAGVLVRRLAVPNADQTLLGIKRITGKPVAVTLQRVPDPSAKSKNPGEAPAIYAPKDGEGTWADSLIVHDTAFSRNADFVVAAGRGTFLVRLTRVLDRGAGWVRAGFRVLSKTA